MTSSERPWNQKYPASSLPSEIAGEQIVAGEFLGGRGRVAPVFEEHDGIGAADGDVPVLARRQWPAAVVDDAHLVAGDGAAHRPRAQREERRVVADDEVALGLAVELVMATPNMARPQSSSSAPKVSPPLPMLRGATPGRRLPPIWRISFKAVGGMKALRTWYFAISAKASSGSNLRAR